LPAKISSCSLISTLFRIDRMEELDDENLAEWELLPWQTDFTTALEKEFMRMKNSLTSDQCTKLEAFLKQTPKRPEVCGVLERIYEREKSACEMDTSSSLSEGTLKQEPINTIAPVTYSLNREPSNSSSSITSKVHTQTTSVATNCCEIVPESDHPVKSNLNETESNQPPSNEELQQPTNALKPWKRFFQYTTIRKNTNWRKFLILETIKFSPCFTVNITDNESTKGYKLTRVIRHKSKTSHVVVKCDSGLCSTLIHLKSKSLSDLISEQNLQKGWKLSF